ncbi:MAG: hypothetical protein K0Q79_1044 [Flavipsychrobacter sp.]|nr:hypothetical protein [Flavipsychrobacter sp.]
MAIVTIGTPFNIDLEFKTASIGKRMLAWLVDIVIISFYFWVMLTFVHPLFEMGETLNTSAFLMIIVPILFYQLMLEMLNNGQTIGKKLAGIGVIDIEGKEPSIGQYILRWVLCLGNLFVYIIPYLLLVSPFALVFCLFLYLPDFLTVVIAKKSQRLGDFAAGTVVIDKKYRPSIDETIYLHIENKNYQPMFPQVMRLTDRDINGIRNLLNVKNTSRDTVNYTLQVVNKIKAVLSIESDMDPEHFLQQLLWDYNYYTAQNMPRQ